MRSLLFLTVLAAPLLVAGCSSPRDHAPEIRKLYWKAAKRHTRNPVVVVHGILGSRLAQRATKRTVWGAFTNEALNPSTREGARALALPFEDLSKHAMPDLAKAATLATGPLQAIKLSLVFAVINVGVYADILKSLGVGGYGDPVGVDPASPAYANDHFTCHTFFYDWRRDCTANARLLGKFLEQTRTRINHSARRRIEKLRKEATPEGLAEATELEEWLAEGYRFDVVAHSMGGLLARYYLRYGSEPLPMTGGDPAVTWAGAQQIDRLVLVGTPSLGSMDAMQNLLKGFSPGGVILPTFDAAILGTMPSIYQLMPRGDGLVLGEDGERLDVDLFDSKVWDENQWGLLSPDSSEYLEWFLPDVADPAERRRRALEVVENNLERARRFHRAIDTPAPGCPADVCLFAADTESTLERVRLTKSDGLWCASFDGDELWEPGDATVTRRSALADLRPEHGAQKWLHASVNWSNVTFLPDDHIGLTKNPIFTDNLLFYLLEQPPRRRN